MNKADLFDRVKELESMPSEKMEYLEFDTSIHPQLTLREIQLKCLKITRPLRKQETSFILQIANISSDGEQVIETWVYAKREILPGTGIFIYDAAFGGSNSYDATYEDHARLVIVERGVEVTVIPEQ